MLEILPLTARLRRETYHEAKQFDIAHREARRMLKGPGGPFEGWILTGPEWEQFYADGTRLTLSNGAETVAGSLLASPPREVHNQL